MKANDAYATISVDVPTTENVAYMTADSSISPPQDTTHEQVFPQADAVGTENEAYTTADYTTRVPQDVTYEQVLPEADESDINAYDYVIYNEP